MTSLLEIEAYEGDKVHAVVEAPKGAAVKLAFDPELAAFKVARALPLGLTYPFDWGFVPGTLGEDGDPLDALMLHEQATFPGVVIACRLLAVVAVEQRLGPRKRGRNDRLILVPVWNQRLARVAHHRALPKQLRAEIDSFFTSATFFTDKDPRILGWRDAKTAARVIDAGCRARAAHGAMRAARRGSRATQRE